MMGVFLMILQLNTAVDDRSAPVKVTVENVTLPAGFCLELIYSVPRDEQGSWVALTPDDKGRLIVSDQFGSLYRVTIGEPISETKVERLPVSIGHAQRLLYAYDSLFVSVNVYTSVQEKIAEGSALYRVLDSDGDDQFDEVKLLKRLIRGSSHGPHGLSLGPDGLICLVVGNATNLPQDADPNSPYRGWADDLLVPSSDTYVPGGWIARTDFSGTRWEILCGGLRNPYDIAFNEEGELFTCDADSETDIGTAWYRPTRLNHVVSAAE